jgi:hypothetical protein
MARSTYLNLSGISQHVVQRGNNRQAKRILEKVSSRSTRLCINDPSCAFTTDTLDTERCQSVTTVFGALLCKACEPYITANGFIMGRAIQIYIGR